MIKVWKKKSVARLTQVPDHEESCVTYNKTRSLSHQRGITIEWLNYETI